MRPRHCSPGCPPPDPAPRAQSQAPRSVRAAIPARFGILSGGEVSEWLMVPLSKSGVRKHRGFESRPLRHDRPRARTPMRASSPAVLAPAERDRKRCRRSIMPLTSPRGRGRLVDYGAALEMRFGATHRGFESRPLRHSPRRAWIGPCEACRLRASLTEEPSGGGSRERRFTSGGVRSARSSDAAFASAPGACGLTGSPPDQG